MLGPCDRINVNIARLHIFVSLWKCVIKERKFNSTTKSISLNDQKKILPFEKKKKSVIVMIKHKNTSFSWRPHIHNRYSHLNRSFSIFGTPLPGRLKLKVKQCFTATSLNPFVQQFQSKQAQRMNASKPARDPPAKEAVTCVTWRKQENWTTLFCKHQRLTWLTSCDGVLDGRPQVFIGLRGAWRLMAALLQEADKGVRMLNTCSQQ